MKQQIIFALNHIKTYSSDNIFRDIFCETMYRITNNVYWLHKMNYLEDVQSVQEKKR